MTPSVEDIRDLFRGHDLRCTRQREVIYAALAGTRSHPTAEELFQMVRATDADLSLATVYNTLEAFQDARLCRRISTGPGACRYDADVCDHVHMTTADGRVIDLPDDLSGRILAAVPPELRREVEARMGVSCGHVGVQLIADVGTKSKEQRAND